MRLIQKLQEETISTVKNVLRPCYQATVKRWIRSYRWYCSRIEPTSFSTILRQPCTQQKITMVSILSFWDPQEIRAMQRCLQSQEKPDSWIIFYPVSAIENPSWLTSASFPIQLIPYASTEEINHELGRISSDWVLFYREKTRLSRHALAVFQRCLTAHPQVSLLYSDHDFLNEKGKRVHPVFKPDFQLHNLYSRNDVSALMLIQKSLGDAVNWFSNDFRLPNWDDFILRIAETQETIYHIPQILVHFLHENPLPFDPIPLQKHFARMGIIAKVTQNDYPSTARVNYLTQGTPRISIIIPNRDQTAALKRCIESISAKTTYPNYEILIAENGSTDPELFSYYAESQQNPNYHVLIWEKKFNYSAINNWAANQSKGDYLLFLNNDTEILSADWLEEMLSLAHLPKTGAVGAKLFFPNGTLQHAGIGLGNAANHWFFHWMEWMDGDAPGYQGMAKRVTPCLAVTAACLMIQREKFFEAGGLDPVFPLAFNDVDLCLNLHNRGYVNLYTPYAKLIHHESLTRGATLSKEKKEIHQRELHFLQTRWDQIMNRPDPYHSPVLQFEHYYHEQIE